MNGKHLLILMLLAGAAVYGVMSLQPQMVIAPDAGSEAELLYPQLSEQIASLETVRLSKAGAETVVELTREQDQWLLANRDHYPANIRPLSDLLDTLSAAKIIETKTSNAERYSALNVEDVSQPEARGVQLEWGDDALIIGKTNASGTFVRKAGVAQAVLVNKTLTPPQTISEWIAQPIIELPAEKIQQVMIRHQDGETLQLAKASPEDKAFKVLDIPAGRALTYATVAAPIGNALSNLRADDVQAALEISEPALLEAEYIEFDGATVTVQLWQQDEQYWVQLKRTAATEDEATDEAGEWVYQIAQYAGQSLNKRMEDLLASEAEVSALEAEQNPASLAGAEEAEVEALPESVVEEASEDISEEVAPKTSE